MRPYCLAALLALFCLPTASLRSAPNPFEASENKWEREIAAYEAKDQAEPPAKGAVLFVGSSSIRLWKSVAEDFPNQKVINRGFGGSQIADSVFFFERIVLPYKPAMIVFYAGGNDIKGGKSAYDVAADFRAFGEKVSKQLPGTKLAFISSAPNPARWHLIDQIKTLNSLVKTYCSENPNMIFIDVFPAMLGADGQPKPEIFREDKLHMNAEGYKIWREIVAPYLPAGTGK